MLLLLLLANLWLLLMRTCWRQKQSPESQADCVLVVVVVEGLVTKHSGRSTNSTGWPA